MENNEAISVKNLVKVYHLYHRKRDRLKEVFSVRRTKYSTPFHALKNINFTVKKGESLGIVGKNGSGKSTLLKILTGVLSPTEGEVNIEGRISALLELGTGFNNEYTGMENIYLQGVLMGFSHEEMEQKVAEIVEFADIGVHIHQPVKTYSSGMFVRLAFAVAISVDPDILIVDEALSVGDIRFQRKCFRKIEEFKKNKTFVLVSHDLGTVSKFCDRVIWINDGAVIRDGNPLEVTKEFRAFMIEAKFQEHRQKSVDSLGDAVEYETIDYDPILSDVSMMGDERAEFIGTLVLDHDGKKTTSLNADSPCSVGFRLRAATDITDAIIGFTIKNRLGHIIFQTNTFVIHKSVSLKADVAVDAQFEFTMPKLIDGYYTISPAIASGTMSYHVQHCWLDDAVVIQVLNRQSINLEGFVYIDDVDFTLDAGGVND